MSVCVRTCVVVNVCVCVCACMCGGERVCLCVRLPLCASATPLQLPLPVCLSCQEARLGPEGRWDELMQQGAERCFVRRDGGALGVWALEHELRPGGSAVRCVHVCVCVCERERQRWSVSAEQTLQQTAKSGVSTWAPLIPSPQLFVLVQPLACVLAHGSTRTHAHVAASSSLGRSLGGKGPPASI